MMAAPACPRRAILNPGTPMIRGPVRFVTAVCVALVLAVAVTPGEGRVTPAAAPSVVARAPAQNPPALDRSSLLDPTHAPVDLRWMGGVGAPVLAALLLLL